MDLSLQDVFINNLKFFRKKNGISQEVLAEKLNKSIGYINKIENKASFPTIQVIEQISSILHIKPYQLFCEDQCAENIIGIDKEKFIQDITHSLYEKLTQDIRIILDKKICL